MAYVSPDFKTKKELKEAVRAGKLVTVFQEGMFPLDPSSAIAVEGPHYPKPHTWYARVEVRDGRVVKVIG